MDPAHSQAHQSLVQIVFKTSYYFTVTADKEIKEVKEKEVPTEGEVEKTEENKVVENNNVIDDVKPEIKEEIKTETKEPQPVIENE